MGKMKRKKEKQMCSVVRRFLPSFLRKGRAAVVGIRAVDGNSTANDKKRDFPPWFFFFLNVSPSKVYGLEGGLMVVALVRSLPFISPSLLLGSFLPLLHRPRRPTITEVNATPMAVAHLDMAEVPMSGNQVSSLEVVVYRIFTIATTGRVELIPVAIFVEGLDRGLRFRIGACHPSGHRARCIHRR